MTDMAHLSVGFGVGVHLHQSFCHIVISVQYMCSSFMTVLQLVTKQNRTKTPGGDDDDV
jgi:hypothetical protein